MKQGIHPEYYVTEVTCGCGSSFVTRSTSKVTRIEICSACHPFYTGKQKFVDTAGRVEKFQRKYAWKEGQLEGATPAPEGAATRKAAKKPGAVRTRKAAGASLKALVSTTQKAARKQVKSQVADDKDSAGKKGKKQPAAS